MNLSGGEKAAFDLILDLIVARRAFDNTIYCIDEPESHMNTRLQAELLTVLWDLVPENCQLLVATHALGMMRRARDINRSALGKVAFIDLGGHDYDRKVVIEPTAPDRRFWANAYDVALDDLAALVAPERVVICEGEPKNMQSGSNYAHDAQCYQRVFEEEFPETQFVPGGNAGEVWEDRRGIAYALGLLVGGTRVLRLIDRDDRSEDEVVETKHRGVCVLSRRNLESYLFDDEVLRGLASSVDYEDRVVDLLAKKQRICSNMADRAADDLKPASPHFSHSGRVTS